MTRIRLMSPEAAAQMNADVAAIGDAIGAHLRNIGATIKRGFAAQAEQRRRDLDDELDWIGEWRGRRG